MFLGILPREVSIYLPETIIQSTNLVHESVHEFTRIYTKKSTNLHELTRN